jgi:hypothetical protein
LTLFVPHCDTYILHSTGLDCILHANHCRGLPREISTGKRSCVVTVKDNMIILPVTCMLYFSLWLSFYSFTVCSMKLREERDGGFKNVLDVNKKVFIELLTLLVRDGPCGLQSSLHVSVERVVGNVLAHLSSCSYSPSSCCHCVLILCLF